MADGVSMTDSAKCYQCGEALFRDDVFCPACGGRRSGEALAAAPPRGATRVLAATGKGKGEPVLCPSCGAFLLGEETFCTACGHGLGLEGDGDAGDSNEGIGKANEGQPVVGQSNGAQSDEAHSNEVQSDPEEKWDAWPGVRAELVEATRGEFEIVRELGRGGMAAVYLGRDLALGRAVAIKVMAPGLLMGPGMVERFRQEAVTIANLHHPNIVTIHTVRQAERLHFFVMQVVEGGSLEGLLEQPDPLPIERIRSILIQVGTGLAYAHNNGVIHRDIKPANVLLDSEGKAILTDFGIAKVTTATNLTQTGSTIGTPQYMSPEQCQAGELSPSSDQYSLGVLAYEMLTGQTPFQGTPFAIMQAHASEAPAEIRVSRPDCPPELEAVVLRMLAKEPTQRFLNVAEAVRAITGEQEGFPHPLRSSESSTSSVSSKRRKVFLALGAVLAVGAVVTLAVMGPGWFSSAGPTPTAQEASAVTSVTFLNPSESVLVGASLTVRPEVLDAEGRAILGEEVVWTSDDPTVASVEGQGGEGSVAGLAPGTASISAEVGGVRESFLVTVSEPAPGELTISTSRRELLIGEELALIASLTDETGAPIQDAAISWQSSRPGVVDVGAESGVARGLAEGQANITATAGDRSASTNLRVLGRIESIRIQPPEGPIEVGQALVIRSTVNSQPEGYFGPDGLAWTSSDPAVASVSAAEADSAVLFLLNEGETTLTAMGQGAEGILTLRVDPAPVDITLQLSVARITFEGVEAGPSLPEQVIGVQVSGDASPSIGVVRYEGGGGDWLRQSLGTAPGQGTVLRVSVDPSDLAPGSYTASVPVRAGEETRVLEVDLLLAPDPALGPIEPNEAAAVAVSALLDAYVAGLNARDASRAQELFPSLGQEAIEELLGIPETDQFYLALVPGSLRLGDQEETLEGDVMSSVLGPDGQGETHRVTYTFGRGDQGWFIVSFRVGG